MHRAGPRRLQLDMVKSGPFKQKAPSAGSAKTGQLTSLADRGKSTLAYEDGEALQNTLGSCEKRNRSHC
jgi:hypothetical protein